MLGETECDTLQRLPKAVTGDTTSMAKAQENVFDDDADESKINIGPKDHITLR